jgi:hypothetical protein
VKLHVISACYEKPHLAWMLEESCALFNVPLTMKRDGVFEYNYRTHKVQPALEMSLAIRDADPSVTHIMWMDGFDTFITKPPSVILNQWAHLGRPRLLLAGEKACWPDPDVIFRYPPSHKIPESPFRFINAGAWLGQIEYVIGALSLMLQMFPDEENDQRVWTTLYVGNCFRGGAIIDTECCVFQTMCHTLPSEINPHACVYHYNGGIWRDPNNRQHIDHWERIKREHNHGSQS